jgi:hypothetical protein
VIKSFLHKKFKKKTFIGKIFIFAFFGLTPVFAFFGLTPFLHFWTIDVAPGIVIYVPKFGKEKMKNGK